MAWFKIQYLTQSGGIDYVSQEAENRDQAIANSGVPRQVIQSVTIDHLGAIKAQLRIRKIPLVDQALVLAAVASKVSSGKTFSKAIIESVDLKKLDLTPKSFENCNGPHEYLIKLRFDDTAILLAEAGDKSGRLPESLTRASNSILDRLKSAKEFGSALMQGAFYTILGLGLMIAVPIWAGYTLRDFIEVQRIPLLLNPVSKTLLFLHDFYVGLWPFLLVGGVLFFLFRHRVWMEIRHLPGLSFINERMKIKRALDFVVSYQIMQASGFPNLIAFRFFMDRSKGHAHTLYAQGHSRLSEGRELSDVFNSDEWPALLHQNLQGFDDQTPAGRDNVLTNLAEALKTYYLQYSERIARTATIVGMLMMVMTVFMFAIGFYMPFVNLQSALKAS